MLFRLKLVARATASQGRIEISRRQIAAEDVGFLRNTMKQTGSVFVHSKITKR